MVSQPELSSCNMVHHRTDSEKRKAELKPCRKNIYCQLNTAPGNSDLLNTNGETDINFQRVPVVDTSNPFTARWIPTSDESLVVIRFKDPHGIDFPYLVSMIDNSWMSRANSIVIPGGKLDLAMQLILTPLIHRLVHQSKRA